MQRSKTFFSTCTYRSAMTALLLKGPQSCPRQRLRQVSMLVVTASQEWGIWWHSAVFIRLFPLGNLIWSCWDGLSERLNTCAWASSWYMWCWAPTQVFQPRSCFWTLILAQPMFMYENLSFSEKTVESLQLGECLYLFLSGKLLSLTSTINANGGTSARL